MKSETSHDAMDVDLQLIQAKFNLGIASDVEEPTWRNRQYFRATTLLGTSIG